MRTRTLTRTRRTSTRACSEDTQNIGKDKQAGHHRRGRRCNQQEARGVHLFQTEEEMKEEQATMQDSAMMNQRLDPRCAKIIGASKGTLQDQ